MEKTDTKTDAAREAGQKNSELWARLKDAGLGIFMFFSIFLFSLGGYGAICLYEKYGAKSTPHYEHPYYSYTYGAESLHEDYIYKVKEVLEGNLICEAVGTIPTNTMLVRLAATQYPLVFRDKTLRAGIWFTISKDGKPTLINPGGYIKTSR